MQCGLCSCKFLADINNFGFGAILLLCLVSGPQKPSSLGINPTSVCQGCDFCFYNLLSETCNVALGAFLLSCLVSELQQPPSPGLELRTFFRGFTFLKPCVLMG
jgi:hypothetical protein